MSQQNHRISLQPAFILHGRNFRDTSRLLDVFTEDYGRINLVAKGARSARSKLQGILEPFKPLLVSWSGKGEVQTLTGAESVKNNIDLSGKQIMSAYYINELIQRLITQHDPHPELFNLYKNTLAEFKDNDEEHVLRCFETNLLIEIGYALNLNVDITTGEPVDHHQMYYYDIESGPINTKDCDIADRLTVSGQTLLDMSEQNYSNLTSKKEAKQLMRIILSHHLGDNPLKTRNLHWYKPL